jgi:hypothetical protein
MNNAGLAMRPLAITVGVALLFTAFAGTQFAAGQLQSGNQNSFQSQTITGDNLKNNPMVEKILSEIEYSKKQIAELQKNQKDAELNKKLIDQQRLIAAQLESQALQLMELNNTSHTPKVAFGSFVSTINNTNVQNVYWGEFNFMSQRVDAGHAAMKKILDNGGTWEEAILEFSKYAAIKRTEMIELNKNLNVQYGLADPNVQNNFDRYGMLPDNYIRVPSSVYSHV